MLILIKNIKKKFLVKFRTYSTPLFLLFSIGTKENSP